MGMIELIIGLAGVLLAALGLILAIYHHHHRVVDLRVSLNPSVAPNQNGVGTHLASIVTISNAGKEPVFFGGFYALDEKGECCYPNSTITCDSKLEPGQYLQGTIPAQTLFKMKVLWAVDGTGRKYRVNRWLLRKVKRFLKEESARWRALELEKNAT